MDSSHSHSHSHSNSTSSDAAVLPKVRTPRLYKVILLNDDFTPMDFVTLVLQKFFKKDLTEAEKIMMEVHKKGAGLAGIYGKEVAEMKVHQVDQFAKAHQHPLKCVMEVE